MKSFTTQILLIVASVIFLIKGGIGILAAAWKFVLPVMFLGGAYYLGRKALKNFSSLSPESNQAGRVNAGASKSAGNPVKGKASEKGGVIEICPHCLSEVGSCSKCR